MLHLHRVLVLGQLRPRGPARLLAPSTALVKDMLNGAGAQVVMHVDEHPTFAIIAPGLTPETSEQVAQLVDRNILCLGSAFIIDLVLRVSADSSEYVLFSSQKHLCAPRLDASSIVSQQSPLIISKNAPIAVLTDALPQKALSDCSSPVILPAKPLPSKVEDEANRTNLSTTPLSTPKKKSEVSSESAEPPSHSKIVLAKRPSQSKRVHSNGPKPNKGINLSPRHKSPKKISKPQPALKAKRELRSSPTSKKSTVKCVLPLKADLSLEKGADPPPATIDLTSSQDQPAITATTSTSKPDPVGERGNSRNNPRSDSSKAIHVQDSLKKLVSESSKDVPIQDNVWKRSNPGISKDACTERVMATRPETSVQIASSREPIVIPSDDSAHVAETRNPPRKTAKVAGAPVQRCSANREHPSKGERRQDEAISRKVFRKESSSATIPGRSAHSTPYSERKRRRIPSNQLDSDDDDLSPMQRSRSKPLIHEDEEESTLQKGYDFIMKAIGGEPSVKSVKRLLKSVGAPEEHWGEEELDLSQEGDPFFPNNQGFEESPEMNEEVDTLLNGTGINSRLSQRNVLTNDDLFRKDDSENRGLGTQTQTRRGDESGSRSMGIEIASLSIPKEPIRLTNVTRSELAFVESAHLLNISVGNSDDDHVCQESVSFVEWLLGAENLIGFVSQDVSAMTQSGMATTSRKLWSSLFESKVFDRLASPGSLSESHVAIITGICIRLIICDFRPEVCKRLLQELLKVREKQKMSSMDSLHFVLTSTNLDTVPFRHRAIASVWVALFHMASRKGEENYTQQIIDEALQSYVDDIFQTAKSTDRVQIRVLDRKISAFSDTLKLVSLMFAVRLDIFDSDGDDVNSVSGLVPENWALICKILDRFSKNVSSFGREETSRVMLTALLRNLTLKFCASMWNVTDVVLQTVAQAILAVCRLETHSCFCEKAPLHTVQFSELCSLGGDVSKLKNLLRTPCDYSLYLGWQLVMHGSGNGMKRVMNVIRNGSLFTNSNGKGSDAALRAMHHHVGLVVTMADCVSKNSSSEEHVCKMLTSKCTDLVSMLKGKEITGGDNDRKWDCVFQAMVVRCRLIVKRDGSVHVYVKWLCEGISESVLLMKRLADRRSEGVKERELMRVQESLVFTAALKRLKTMNEVLSLVGTKMREGDLDRDIISKYVESIGEHAVNLLAFCRESIERMRMKYAHAAVRNRDSLVAQATDLLKTFLELLVYICAERSVNSEGPMGRFMRRQGMYPSIVNGLTEALFVDLMGSEELIQDKSLAKAARSSAAFSLALLIEVRVMTRDSGWNDDGCTSLVEVLSKSNLDISRRRRNGGADVNMGHRANDSGRDLKDLDDGTTLRFWWKAMRSKWVGVVIERCSDVRAVVLGVVGWVLVSEMDFNEEEKKLVEEIRLEARYMEAVRTIAREWVGEGNAGDAANNMRKSESMKRIISCMAAEVGRQKTRALVGQLRSRVMGMLRSKRKDSNLDGLVIFGLLFQVESHGRGFCSEHGARWMQQWIGDMVSCLQRIQHANGGVYAWRRGSEWYEACQEMQWYVMSGLCMTSGDGRDVEMRVSVLRFFNAMDAADDLPGVWKASVGRLVFSEDGNRSAEIGVQRRARRQMTDWRKYAFRSLIEDALLRCLTSGKVTINVLKRLLSATRAATGVAGNAGLLHNVESDHGSGLVVVIKAVVARIQVGRLIDPILRDVAGRLLWKQVCTALNVDWARPTGASNANTS